MKRICLDSYMSRLIVLHIENHTKFMRSLRFICKVQHLLYIINKVNENSISIGIGIRASMILVDTYIVVHR